MKKEIGGYLEFEKLIHNEYYKNLIGVNTSRNALLYIIKTKNIRKIYLPYYLCDSVSECLKKSNISYEFYCVDKSLEPIFDKKLENDEYIYIVNFFGIFLNNKIIEFKNRYKNIIVDNVHAFFQHPINNIDTIYSCRKFFGVPDGAYINCNSPKTLKLDIDKSGKRFSHLFGRLEYNAQSYYNDYIINDENFKNEELKYMSILTKNIMGAIDYDNVIKVRKSNYDILEKNLSNINELKFCKPIVPFCYPLYLKNGTIMRKKLIESKIFIPTLWPNVVNCGQAIEEDYSQNILPIPCDQRYDEKDMYTIIDKIMELINNEKS